MEQQHPAGGRCYHGSKHTAVHALLLVLLLVLASSPKASAAGAAAATAAALASAAATGSAAHPNAAALAAAVATSSQGAASAGTLMPANAVAAASGQQQQQQRFTEPATTSPPAAAEAPAPAASPTTLHADHPPKRVAGVLLNLYQSYAGPVVKAASNYLNFGFMQAEPSPLQLPQCQQTNVLLNSGQFPGLGWANLTAEQQALHPVNLVMMQVAYMAYRPLSDLQSCLTGMGADLSTFKNITVPVEEWQTLKTAYIFRAGRERVFVLFRGSCELDLGINIACRQDQPAHELFGVSGGPQMGIHRGYLKAWQALEVEVMQTVQLLLKEVPSKEVYIVGHSLGAAMGSIAALRMTTILPRGVAGVFMFAAPRAGNAAWAAAYNKVLMHKTIRYSNHMDFAVRAPAPKQSCSLGPMSLRAETGQFDYAHVGRAVLMCPEHDTGLTQFRISAEGSEVLDCFGPNDVDATAATHQLGSYFDAWRRGFYKYAGHNMANDLRVRAVLCQGCTVSTARYRMEQLRCPARAGGPVTCTVDATCSSDAAFGAALAVGEITAVRQGNTCQAYMCQPPSTRG